MGLKIIKVSENLFTHKLSGESDYITNTPVFYGEGDNLVVKMPEAQSVNYEDVGYYEMVDDVETLINEDFESIESLILYLNNVGYISSTVDLSYFVPYAGAINNVDLGSKRIIVDGLTVGTAEFPLMFVKDGAINTYAGGTYGSDASHVHGFVGSFSQVLGNTFQVQGNATFAGTMNVAGALSGITITNLTPTTISESGSTYIIPATRYVYALNFTGIGCTATLPLVPTSNNRTYYISNFGSGDLVINTFSGGNDLYISGAATNTVTVPPGGTLLLHSGNNKFIKFA